MEEMTMNGFQCCQIAESELSNTQGPTAPQLDGLSQRLEEVFWLAPTWLN
jgi:hypothetical protein